MYDPYRKGAAAVTQNMEVSKADRDRFKRAFFECLYDYIKMNPQDNGDALKDKIAIISNGVEQGFSDARIRELIEANARINNESNI